MPVRLLGALVLLALVASLSGAAAAQAAPPPNDAPAGAGSFTPVTAEDGRPRELQAIAEMAEATPDSGAPACFGRGSFARTVWYLIPAAETPQELTVDASGRTLAVVDLAAYVQAEGATILNTPAPNACAGLGSGGADAAEEPGSAVSLRVPARRAVLIQVGRRGPVGTPDDERVVLSLDARPLTLPAPPPGDFGSAAAPRAGVVGPSFVALGGATITEEDPFEPPCPSLGTVWRRLVPTRTGPRVISAAGGAVSTLTVFQGGRPTADNVLDCVNRGGPGALQMNVPARARKPLWIRIGTDAPADNAEAKLSVLDGARALVVDGGPGGYDPTSGGPGGGFPSYCLKSDPAHAKITGKPLDGKPKSLNRRPTIALTLTVRRSSACDVQLELVGPRGHVYGRGQAIALRGKRVVRLRRVRELVRGGYRLRVTAVSQRDERVRVPTDLRGRLHG